MASSSDRGMDTVQAGPIDLLDDGDDALPLDTPATIGKYAIVGLLGLGGMGSVYRAVDPDLEREVAVKVLKASVLRNAGLAERTSLLREAKALARLNHPNVVSVYEVGEDRGGFFIAMELFGGSDLQTWLGTRPSKEDILARFVEAGRGLQAAHDAGLVHRDFKPGNVLVSEQGAKVTDFGLARGTTPEASMSLSSSSGSFAFESTGTQGGTVMGTPAYMSPEQHRGESLDAATDQYSFCIALYEALGGERPFTMTKGRSLLRAKLKGPPPVPPQLGVASHVERALRRGLSPRPEDRFPSMTALLRELQRDPAATRRRVLAGAGLAAAGGLVAWAVGLALADEPEPCVLATDTFTGVWDRETKAAVEEAFRATNQVYALRTYRRVEQRLDDYAVAWTEAWGDACRATVVEKVQSQRLLDMRIACLEERRVSLRALTRAMSKESADMLDRADTMVRSLPPLGVCSNLDQLESQVPDPGDAIAESVGEARTALAFARVMQAAGQSAVAVRELEGLQPIVDALAYPPLTAEVALLRGQALDAAARHEEAEARLVEATWAAYGVDHHRVVAHAAMALVWNVSGAQSRGSEGRIWLDLADAAARRVPDDRQLRAEVANTRGVLLQDLGDAEGARKAFELVLSLLEDTEGAEALPKAGALVNLAILESEAGRFEEAYALQQQALVLRETYEGRAHPRTAALLNNMSTVLVALDRHREAKEANTEALAQLRARYGDTHPLVGTALVQKATLVFEDGDRAEAVEYLRQAAKVFEAARGMQHRDLAIIYNNIGEVELKLGNAAAAIAAMERALEIVRANYEPGSERVAAAEAALAKAVRRAEASP